MQTYTHLLIGVASAPFISHTPSIQALWVIGNVLPDCTLTVQYITDLLTKKQPLAYEPPLWVTLKNILHSLVLASLIIMIGLVHDGVFLFGCGMLCHIIIDILTHTRENSNCIYAFPFRMESFCIWEYQIGKGILWPRPLEFGICILCITLIYIRL